MHAAHILGPTQAPSYTVSFQDSGPCEPLSLDAHIVTHPYATYTIRVRGTAMRSAGIYLDDLLVVDRAIAVQDNAIVVAIIEDIFEVRRYRQHQGRHYLLADQSDTPPLEIGTDREFIWGVVTYCIHKPV